MIAPPVLKFGGYLRLLKVIKEINAINGVYAIVVAHSQNGKETTHKTQLSNSEGTSCKDGLQLRFWRPGRKGEWRTRLSANGGFVQRIVSPIEC